MFRINKTKIIFIDGIFTRHLCCAETQVKCQRCTFNGRGPCARESLGRQSAGGDATPWSRSDGGGDAIPWSRSDGGGDAIPWSRSDGEMHRRMCVLDTAEGNTPESTHNMPGG